METKFQESEELAAVGWELVTKDHSLSEMVSAESHETHTCCIVITESSFGWSAFEPRGGIVRSQDINGQSECLPGLVDESRGDHLLFLSELLCQETEPVSGSCLEDSVD